MLQPVFEVAYEAITIVSYVYSLSIGKSSPPLSIITLISLFLFGVFEGEIEPIKDTFAMFFVILKLTNVQIAIVIDLYPFPSFFIQLESTLVDLSCFFDVDAPTMSFPSINLPKIDLAITFDQFQFVALYECINV